MSNQPPVRARWPRPMLDSGSPRRTRSCGTPKPAHISLTRVAHSTPDRHPPSRPHSLRTDRGSENFVTPPLTTSSPYQAVQAAMGAPEEPDEPARRESCPLGFRVRHVSDLGAVGLGWLVGGDQIAIAANSSIALVEARRAEPVGDELLAGSSEQRAHRHMRVSVSDGHGGRAVASDERDRGRSARQRRA